MITKDYQKYRLIIAIINYQPKCYTLRYYVKENQECGLTFISIIHILGINVHTQSKKCASQYYSKRVPAHAGKPVRKPQSGKRLKSCSGYGEKWRHILFFLLLFFYLQWILSYIEMKQPWVYMCSPSRSPLPPPSPPDPSRSSQCTRSERLSHASNLGW